MKAPPPQIGDLIEVHRPMSPVLAWAIDLALPVGLFLLFGIGLQSPWFGLLGFAVTFPMLFIGTSEWFFIEHRFHEHGVHFVTRVPVPLLSSYVVRWRDCELDSITVVGRKVHDGTMEDAISRTYRQVPTMKHNVTFKGTSWPTAQGLAKGTTPWEIGADLAPELKTLLESQDSFQAMKRNKDRWSFTSRTPEHHVDLIRTLIARAHADQ